MLKKFGLASQNEIVGTSLLDWVAPEHQKEIIDKQRNLFEGLTGLSLTYRLTRRDKSSFIAEVNESTIHDPLGKPIGVMAGIRDVAD
jgi:PAS domain S-box-containing protein